MADSSKQSYTPQPVDTKSVSIANVLKLLAPPCCHVSGMHDPVHFTEDKYICAMQKAEAYDRICELLGTNYQPKDAVSKPDCHWCKNYPDKRHHWVNDLQPSDSEAKNG